MPGVRQSVASLPWAGGRSGAAMAAEMQKLQLSLMRKLMVKAEAAEGGQKKKIMQDIKELQASMASKATKRPASDGAAGAASSKRPRSGPILSGGPVLREGGADYRHDVRQKRPPQPCRFGAACKRKGRGCKFSHVEKVAKVHLPIMDHKSTLLEAFDQHLVSIVSGDTGCGKSTQVPQIIMEHDPKAVVLCTQPRRLAAIALAQRVAAERGEEIGSSVGYRISRNSKAGTRCTFMTIGLFLQLLIHHKDEALDGVTHVVIDEAHEREVDLDLVLTVLKRALVPVNSATAQGTPREPPFRLIIMSATFNADIFAGYFAHVPVRATEEQSGGPANGIQSAPVLKVGAKCFPVTSIYTDDLQGLPGFPTLKDTTMIDGSGGYAEGGGVGSAVESGAIKLDKKLYDATVWILQHLHKMEDGQHEGISLPPHSQAGKAGGAVLIFCPGVPEIYDLLEAFAASGIDDRRFLIIPLHSLLEDKQQDEIFRVPPHGKRKVIIGTNIAESSITVNDISYIIDLGLEKLPYFDPKNNTDELQLRRASQASAAQRAGRAGRVAEGTCFRLYSRLTFNTAMPAFAPPEMVRCSLVNLVLKVKLIEPSTAGGEAASCPLLAECLQPPSLESVQQSLNQLTFLGATSRDGRVTTLGVILSHLPQLDLRIARLLLIAHAFDCFEDGATIAAGLAAHQDVYVQPFAKPASGEDKAFAKLRTDWEFAQQDVKHFAPKLGRALETGVQSAPITVLRLYNDWVATRDAEGRESAKEFAQAECASAKRLHQMDLTRQDLIRRLKQEGFGNHTSKSLNASAAPFIPGAAGMDADFADRDGNEDRVGGGHGVSISGTAGEGQRLASTSNAGNVPDEQELLYKALLVAAFCPSYAVGNVGPQQRIRADGFDLSRTVIYKLLRSEPPASGAGSSGPTEPHGQAPEDFTVNMPAFQSAMETCCYSNGPPRLVLRTVGQEHFLVVEFPSEHAAILGVRLVGLRRQLAVFGGSRAPGGGLPLLTDPVYSRKLSFRRPAHKTEMDHASGEARGHLVEMHWQSCCAILHISANTATRIGNEDDGAAGYSTSEEGVMESRRYLVTAGFQRAGVSKNRLLAIQPTLLSAYPMVAELTLLLFAREASWLVATATSRNVFKTELAGAEVGSGDDTITLIFTAVLTEEDIQSINHIRSTLSNRMGTNLGGGPTMATGEGGSQTLRSQLSTCESALVPAVLHVLHAYDPLTSRNVLTSAISEATTARTSASEAVAARCSCDSR